MIEKTICLLGLDDFIYLWNKKQNLNILDKKIFWKVFRGIFSCKIIFRTGRKTKIGVYGGSSGAEGVGKFRYTLDIIAFVGLRGLIA